MGRASEHPFRGHCFLLASYRLLRFGGGSDGGEAFGPLDTMVLERRGGPWAPPPLALLILLLVSVSGWCKGVGLMLLGWVLGSSEESNQ